MPSQRRRDLRGSVCEKDSVADSGVRARAGCLELELVRRWSVATQAGTHTHSTPAPPTTQIHSARARIHLTAMLSFSQTLPRKSRLRWLAL